MVRITVQMVKELREKTGVGVMDCKRALMKREVIEDAIVFLREKGLAKVVKKLGKIVVEGLIGLEINDNSAALVEVNCETDFVARGSEFRVLVVNLVKQALLFNFCKKELRQLFLT